LSVVSGIEVAKYCKNVARINPNGVDLLPKEVTMLPNQSTIYLHGSKRGYVNRKSGEITVPKADVTPNKDGFYSFRRGALYELRFAEVQVPADCTGLAFPRSSLNRLGIIKLESGVFDSGYSGEPTQTIFTPINALVHKSEAMVQLVFFRNEKTPDSLYNGYYHSEKGRQLQLDFGLG